MLSKNAAMSALVVKVLPVGGIRPT